MLDYSYMNNKEVLLNIIKKKKVATGRELILELGFSRAYINKIINELIRDGKVARLGQTNKTRYVLADNEGLATELENIFQKSYLREKTSEDLILEELGRQTNILKNLPERLISIFNYAFTEMINNAIDHSGSQDIKVTAGKRDDLLWFEVIDFGVGIFEHIKKKKGLEDRWQAMQDLTKGKQTTDPEHHAGEGVFFTSKIGDKFTIISGGITLVFDNNKDDIFVSETAKTKGTKVIWTINKKTTHRLTDIFKKYSNENFSFAKTEVRVDLFKINSPHISRSEAKRLLAGLEKFDTIILDFKGIELIGQGFADEIFRVWQKKYPRKILKPINYGKAVEMMIGRAKNNI